MVALAAGRHVASSWGATLYAAVLVHDPDHMPGDSKGIGDIESALAKGGADKVVVAVSKSEIAPLWAAIGNAWQGVIDHLRPRLVLFGADAPSSAELGPRTAARIGARLLLRARASGIDDVELRDRDGGYARASDGGAAVAMIGRAARTAAVADDCDVDVVVLEPTGEHDPRVELGPITRAAIAQTAGTVIALGDELATDPKVTAAAQKLATLLDAHLVGGTAARRAGAIDKPAVVERTTALAPELCITIGAAQVDVAGAASVIKIGATPTNRVTAVDGSLAGLADIGLAELVKKLERL